MRVISTTALMAVILTPVPSFAAQAAQEKYDPNDRICRVIPPPTGTRLRERKVCMSRAEWQARREQEKEAVDNMRGMSAGSDNG